MFDDYVCDEIGRLVWKGKIEEILLSDEKFVEDLDNFPGLLMNQKFKGKTLEEMKEFLHQGVIGNTCRTYILNVLAMKHLYRMVKQESPKMLDFFWQPRLDQNLYLESNKNGCALFDKMQPSQTLNLIESLLIDDEKFAEKFSKIFLKGASEDKENLTKFTKSLLTSGPKMEFAVTYFVFKYITNALKQAENVFLDDDSFKNMMIAIEKEFDDTQR